MTKFQTYLIAIACALAAAGIYKFVPDLRVLSALLASAATGLIGWTVPHTQDKAEARDSQAGHAHLHSICAFGLVGLVALLALMFSLPMTSGCRVSPSAFYQATVDCAKVNPERTATSAAVLTCLGEAIAGNAIACIAQLPQTLHWTIDEASCVIADLAQKENTKVGAGTATSRDLDLRNEAVKFMTDNHIRIANTYAGAP